MDKLTLFFLTGAVLITFNSEIFAQQLAVEEIKFGTNVEERELIGEDTVFTTDIESVFCYTRILGAQDTVLVSHIWYHNNEQKARVDLEIRSNNWRTWSSKSILPPMSGNWSVDILGPEGDVLASKSFTVEAVEEQARNQ